MKFYSCFTGIAKAETVEIKNANRTAICGEFINPEVSAAIIKAAIASIDPPTNALLSGEGFFFLKNLKPLNKVNPINAR